MGFIWNKGGFIMAAGLTYEPITTTTISGTSTTTVALTSIPSTYTDLILVTNITTTNNNNGNGWITFNNDTGTNYSQTRMYGGTGISGSDRQTGANYLNLNIGGFNNGILCTCYINNYSNTTTYKGVITRINNVAQYIGQNVGMWRNTNAISRIDVTIHEGYMNAGSTITLYGIAAA
jgi:hypothetical protein